jgi:hypothetical protein
LLPSIVMKFGRTAWMLFKQWLVVQFAVNNWAFYILLLVLS